MTTAPSPPSSSSRRHLNDLHTSIPFSLSSASPPPSYQASVNRPRSKSTEEMNSPTAVTAVDGTRSGFSASSSAMAVPRQPRKSSSSSQLVFRASSAERDDVSEDDDAILYTSNPRCGPNCSRASLRMRPVEAAASTERARERTFSRFERGVREVETDSDDPPWPLPTSRRLPTPSPLSPPTPLARMTPILFQTFRLLSCVPASAGACSHILNLYRPPRRHWRLEYLVCLLWALLTAHQCLRLTTGLLTRWKTYYPPFPTLIRLLALQAICWPATKFTLYLFDHDRRPVVCWAIIGSTTCVSRSIQIWVNSNLWIPNSIRAAGKSNSSEASSITWGQRRWNWSEIGLKCALPMGVLYFVMAWAEVLRRELGGC